MDIIETITISIDKKVQPRPYEHCNASMSATIRLDPTATFDTTMQSIALHRQLLHDQLNTELDMQLQEEGQDARYDADPYHIYVSTTYNLALIVRLSMLDELRDRVFFRDNPNFFDSINHVVTEPFATQYSESYLLKDYYVTRIDKGVSLSSYTLAVMGLREYIDKRDKEIAEERARHEAERKEKAIERFLDDLRGRYHLAPLGEDKEAQLAKIREQVEAFDFEGTTWQELSSWGNRREPFRQHLIETFSLEKIVHETEPEDHDDDYLDDDYFDEDDYDDEIGF